MSRGHGPSLTLFPVQLLSVKRPADASVAEVTGYAKPLPGKSHQEE